MRLAIDSATRHAVVAVGEGRSIAAVIVREVVPGRGTPLLSLIDEALRDAHATMDDIEVIGVGTGPGSFTGLRAGLATAKTLCWLRRLPLVALPTDDSIRRAVALHQPALDAVAVVMGAGARDHYLALPGTEPMLVPPTTDLATLVGDRPVVALDVRSDPPVAALAERIRARGGPDPVGLGTDAIARLPEALLAVVDERLAAGETADLETLVPRYVALPRGIASVPVEQGTSIMDTARRDEAWSPTPR